MTLAAVENGRNVDRYVPGIIDHFQMEEFITHDVSTRVESIHLGNLSLNSKIKFF